MAKSKKASKISGQFWTNFVLILICVVWMVPVLGVLITSFRPSQNIFQSGWWTVFPHRENMQVDTIKLDDSVDVDGPITIAPPNECALSGAQKKRGQAVA